VDEMCTVSFGQHISAIISISDLWRWVCVCI